jgi:DNA-binding response OmpR family regulator
MSSGSGLQKTAIVAASDLDWRSQFRQTLPECGVEPLLFKTAVEAVECAHSVAARLVIIDVRQAVADGLYACRSIRGITNYVSVPIVLLIAAHDASTRTTGRQAGASHFVTLPISIFALKQELLPLLGGSPLEPVASAEWKPRGEPRPLFGDARVLIQGRNVLELHRRADQPLTLRRIRVYR